MRTMRLHPVLILGILLVPVIGSRAMAQSCDATPDHFSFASGTSESYSIVLDSTSGCSLQPCDEVGVFDGSLCVGASVYQGTWPLALVAWANDTQTPAVDGYGCGNTMTFKVWRRTPNLEESATPHYAVGNGTFCNGPFAKLWLSVAGCASLSSVVVESKTVSRNATGIRIGIFLTNDVALSNYVIPLEIRSTTGGAFITNMKRSYPTGTRLDGKLTDINVINWYDGNTIGTCKQGSSGGYTAIINQIQDSLFAVVSPPEAVMFTRGKIFSPALPVGTDGSTPEMVLTVDVNGSNGIFEIDTTCTNPANHLVYAQDITSTKIIPSFTKGVIQISGPAENQKPVARDTSWTTNQNSAKPVSYLPASDPDAAQTLTFAITSGPSHGSVGVFNSATGAFTYTPTTNFTGPDLLTFSVCDNGVPSKCDTGTVNIAVSLTNNAPTARDTLWATDQNTAKSVSYLPASDADPGQTLTFSVVSGPSHGLVSGFNSAIGAFTYTPATNYTGPDALTFSACDNGVPSMCNSGTVTISVLGVTSCDSLPDHFAFSSGTSESYSIVLDSMSGCSLQPCDEVGVFDGSLCVGASVYQGTWPLALVAWANDTQTPAVDGYACGNTMTFKTWRRIPNLEESATPHYAVANGTFCNGPFAKLWLSVADCTGTQNADLALTGLTVLPSSLTTPTFTACSFNIVNNGPTAMSSAHLLVDYYLSSNSTACDGDDIKIGSTPLTWSIGSGGSASITLNSADLGHMVENWPAGVAAGDYYVVAKVSVSSPFMDPNSSNNCTRTSSPINWNPSPGPCDSVPDHFVFRSGTSESYSIVLTSISSVYAHLQTCDEIGVFDGSLCVGASVFEGTWPLALVAWANDTQTPALDGYGCGNTMTFKVWHRNPNYEESAKPNYGFGNGTFCYGPYAQLIITDVEYMETGTVPTVFVLAQNYPNPFNAGTAIQFGVPKSGWITLVVYDVLGREIAKLVDGRLEPGMKSVTWSGTDSHGNPVASGMYLYRLTSGKFVESRKMILLK